MTAAFRNHHRINNHVGCMMPVQCTRHRFDNFRTCQHADLNSIDFNIGKNRINLICNNFTIQLTDICYTTSILSSYGSNHTHTVYPKSSKGF
ncbi:hypothetical protein SDC9_133196 [bioreactor metagenome]|uniref:Uncharacterized protein n=1 Tax=bioreactor metagenome TaxID=1076179 RepID=A0A645DB11_9ZZZZ